MVKIVENYLHQNQSSDFSLDFSDTNSDSIDGGGFKQSLDNAARAIRNAPKKILSKIRSRSPSPTGGKLNFSVISDPEGYDILAQSNFSSENDKSRNLYICGDIIDSTGHIGIDKNNIVDEHRLIAKSNNLKNIQTCLNYSNVHLIFGNRDLNKLKCKWLCELNGTEKYVKQFNDGNILLNESTYNLLQHGLF